MRKALREYIFAIIAVLAFLIILIGAVIQSQLKTVSNKQTQICSSNNPTTSAICRYKNFTRNAGGR